MNYMQINIKNSEKSQDVIRRLTAKLGDSTPRNVIARIALAYSLQKGKKFTSSEFALNEYIEKGTAHLSDLSVSLNRIKNNQQHIDKLYFEGLLKQINRVFTGIKTNYMTIK